MDNHKRDAALLLYTPVPGTEVLCYPVRIGHVYSVEIHLTPFECWRTLIDAFVLVLSQAGSSGELVASYTGATVQLQVASSEARGPIAPGPPITILEFLPHMSRRANGS
jgi:hypothetical protein